MSSLLAQRLELGASLAVQGVCLTVVAFSGRETASPGTEQSAASFPRDETTGEIVDLEVSPETLRRTTLGLLTAGDAVNLEPALRLGDPLGGHWVQGHVDGVGRVSERIDHDQHREIRCDVPEQWSRFVVEKGSLTVDGVSLTIARLEQTTPEAGCWLALIPHTLQVTTLGQLDIGSQVNLEVDVLAKYVDRSLLPYRGAYRADDAAR